MEEEVSYRGKNTYRNITFTNWFSESEAKHSPFKSKHSMMISSCNNYKMEMRSFHIKRYMRMQVGQFFKKFKENCYRFAVGHNEQTS